MCYIIAGHQPLNTSGKGERKVVAVVVRKVTGGRAKPPWMGALSFPNKLSCLSCIVHHEKCTHSLAHRVRLQSTQLVLGCGTFFEKTPPPSLLPS